MIFVIYRYNYKQFIEDLRIHHVFLIGGGMVTVYEEIKSD